MKHGYYTDEGAFNGAFSFWQSANRPGKWIILGHAQFTRDGYAVVDDFGTLVEVQS